MEYQGEIIRVMRVEYRRTVGSGVRQNARLQAIAWVERNGNVLRHDVYIDDSRMRFERQSKVDAAKIGAELFERLLRQGATLKSPEQATDEKAGHASRPPAA